MAMISRTALTEHVKKFDWKAVARGLDENPGLLGHRDERGRNWLHLGCGIDIEKNKQLKAAGSIKLAELLLDRGLGLNDPAFTEGEWKATPLWYAVRGHNLKLVEFLLERGCDPEHCLWAAVFSSQFDAIRLLVKRGARVDADHPEGSPFIAAIKWSRFAAAETLLELGADVDQRDSGGMTALHYMLAKSSDKKTTAEIMGRKRDPEFRELALRLKKRRS